MAFAESIKDEAFRRSGGQCECTRYSHSHFGRCPTKVTRYSPEYHHILSQDAGGSDGLSNCEVLCVTCHKQTASYGAH